jgi:hypothetical protein
VSVCVIVCPPFMIVFFLKWFYKKCV